MNREFKGEQVTASYVGVLDIEAHMKVANNGIFEVISAIEDALSSAKVS